MTEYTEWNGVRYDSRHGGPFDRGSADSYYGRRFNPHYFTGGSYNSFEITEEKMTDKEIKAYTAGYEWNEDGGYKKEW